MKHLFVCSTLAALLISCSGSLPYSIEYPMSNTIFHFRDGDLTGKIPRDWFLTPDDSGISPSSLVFMNTPLSATMVLWEIHLDSLTAQNVHKEGLQLLAAVVVRLREDAPQNVEVRKFNMQRRPFCGIEWGAGNSIQRAVVFASHHHYYVCEARLVKGSGAREERIRLFTVQQTLLASLVW